MLVERHDPPGRPAVTIVLERLAGDGDRLGAVGGARGQGEHEDFGLGTEQGAGVAVADLVDIRLVAVVAADGNLATEVGFGADRPEVVIAAKLAIGMTGDPAQEQVTLDLPGILALSEESASLRSGVSEERQPRVFPGLVVDRQGPTLGIERVGERCPVEIKSHRDDSLKVRRGRDFSETDAGCQPQRL